MNRMAPRLTHVILDRDGVLNVERAEGGYVCARSQWRWIPGTIEGLAVLGAAGVLEDLARGASER